MRHISFKGEGITEFKALLFIPSARPFGMWSTDFDHGLSLYIRNVFIMNDYKELIPQYLRFVRGVVDSEDLSLNISREILQQNKTIKIINNALVRKILNTFEEMLKNERDEYVKLWNNFGSVIKEGIFMDRKHSEKILDISLFASTNDPEKLTSLEEYISRMNDDQDTIYYITGKNRKNIENSPHLEAFKEKNIEVLLLDENVDEVWVQYFTDHKDKKVQSVGKGEVNLKEEKAEVEEKSKEYKSLIEFIKKHLDEYLKDVRLSGRLTQSPACLVGDKSDMTPQLEQMLKATGQEIKAQKRILELNPDHPVVIKMHDLFDKEPESQELKDYAEILYGQAVLAEGGLLPDPGSFAKKLSELMIKVM